MTRLLGSSHIETMSREESVRGVLVRSVLKQAEHADEKERQILESALELLLKRLQSMEGGPS